MGGILAGANQCVNEVRDIYVAQADVADMTKAGTQAQPIQDLWDSGGLSTAGVARPVSFGVIDPRPDQNPGALYLGTLAQTGGHSRYSFRSRAISAGPTPASA